jgi:hypothetical protein
MNIPNPQISSWIHLLNRLSQRLATLSSSQRLKNVKPAAKNVA